MFITFQVHNASSETSIDEFIKASTEIDPGEPLENFNWFPFPFPDPENAGHFKKLREVFDQEPTEEHLPYNVNNVCKVAELEQMSY